MNFAFPHSVDNWLTALSEPEPDALTHLSSLAAATVGRGGIVGRFQLEPHAFPDEPRFEIFRAELLPTRGLSSLGTRVVTAQGGRARTAAQASVGALFEAFERYCLSMIDDRRMEFVTEAELVLRAERFLPLGAFVDDRRPLEDEGARVRRWIRGFDVVAEEPTLVPAQVVFVPFEFPDEPLLRDPISTGAAAGLTLAHAAWRGFLEALERDAVMLAHYAGASVVRVDADSLPEAVRLFAEELSCHHLDLELFLLDNGFPVNNLIARVTDETASLPRFTFGSACRPRFEDAALSAAAEAVSSRRGLRAHLETAQAQELERGLSMHSLGNRAYYWLLHPDEVAVPYLDTAPVASAPPPDAHTRTALLKAVCQAGPVVIVDLTTPDIASLGVRVTKTVIPWLQPMHLDERCFFATRRAKSFNDDAHPTAAVTPHPYV